MAIEHKGFSHNYIADATQTTDYKFVTPKTDALEVDDAGENGVTTGIRVTPAVADSPIEVLTIGQIAKLTLGSGGASIGDKLASGEDGEGIVTTTDKIWVGAIALEDGDDTQVISVLVTGFTLSI